MKIPRLHATVPSLLALLLTSATAHAQWSVPVERGLRPQDTYPDYDPRRHAAKHLLQPFAKEEWEASSYAPKEAVEKWKDMRYGMFIHFSLTAKAQRDLSWGTVKSKAPDGSYSAPGKPCVEPYVQWTKDMKLEKFDAREWVRIAKEAGFKYMVIVTKHHDGFHMWDTEFSDFKITNTPFRRDYLKELVDACHEAKFPVGFYYAQREFYHPDYDPTHPTGEFHKRYIDYNNKVVHELCTKYGKIDIFWFDAAWWNKMFTADMWDSEALYRQIRKDQPDILINNRASIPGDFDTPEQINGSYQERAWETARCLGPLWCYSGGEPRSKSWIIQVLTSSACGNGNMILSWGPHWDGEYDKKETARLLEVGAWLKTNGESVYGTRTGPWLPAAWGGSTKKGKRVYLHVHRAKGGKVTLPSIPERIRSAKLLDGGAKVDFAQTASGVTVQVVEDKEYGDRVVVLELDREPQGQPIRSDLVKVSLFDDVSAYGSRIHEFDASAAKSGASLDLKQVSKVTGVSIPAGGSGSVKIETSSDGKTWREVTVAKLGAETFETSVTELTSGAFLPGRETRYLRITPVNQAKLPAGGRIGVFGFRK